MTKDKLSIISDKLDKVIDLLEKIIEQGNRAEESSKRTQLQQEKQPKKKYLVEDYNYPPLEPVPWWVHSPQYNKGFTCCADNSSELITKPDEETPHELRIK